MREYLEFHVSICVLLELRVRGSFTSGELESCMEYLAYCFVTLVCLPAPHGSFRIQLAQKENIDYTTIKPSSRGDLSLVISNEKDSPLSPLSSPSPSPSPHFYHCPSPFDL